MKTVLPWRIHKHTREEVENMKKLMVELPKIRKFAVFGKELADFTSNVTWNRNLETMSDWTAEYFLAIILFIIKKF
ncbi:hypothetical protein B9Z55_027126 [Caenorhabditis nigoni]|uniref:Uncharacterized protein n=1 Tax=Caenorhabditis nigoni TaxID=1611254 RepID=A0A2G5SJH2_9PELO|nr:hypothetical protein B9Z55_027126 [Caenorhabditis nigoni]